MEIANTFATVGLVLLGAGFAIIAVQTMIDKTKRRKTKVDSKEALAITDIDMFGGQILFEYGAYKGMYAMAVTDEGVPPIRQGSIVQIIRNDREKSHFVVASL